MSTLLLLAACLVADPPTRGPADSDEPLADTAGELPECVDAPVVDWDNFGQGFLLQSCQGCHASTTADRYGAPEEVTFDTVDQAWAWADDILSVAAGEAPTMPPRGGVEEDDRVRLVWWLACGVSGT